MRALVDPGRIRAFLEALGAEFRQPGRILLVGGTTVVLQELRSQTIDIDLVAEIPAEARNAFVDAVRRLKESMDVSVEEVSPAEFIPLPKGYESRAIYVGRFGELDVLHFDPYSTALSKVARGTEKDMEDVMIMVRSGLLTAAILDECYRDILPRYGAESLKQDPERFRRNYALLSSRLSGQT